MLKSFILDDEAHAIELLTEYIGRTPGIELLGSDTRPLEALRKITELTPDVLFLDIDMPDISGLEFMKLLGQKIHIVFTTGHAEYAVEGYNRDIADYLLKPISYSRFNTCCERLVQKVADAAGKKAENAKKFFYIQGDNKAKMIKINMDELFYVQSLNNYVIIYHQSDKLITYLTMKEVEQFLPADRFSRIHKSYLVNDAKIKTIESGHVILHSQPVTALPIGLKYRDQFYSKIRKVTLKRGDWENK
jgi:two-component system LytT family response regulator